MTVYHIGKNGEPSRCAANVKACPLGGEHFTSKTDAKNYIEAKELQLNEGSFSKTFSKSQRKRMFSKNPKMKYTVELDDSVYDSEGDEWIVVSKYYGRTKDHDHILPTIGLAKVNGGEELLLDPYREGRKIADFSMPTPAPVVLDGPPVRDSEKFQELPKGKSVYNKVFLQSIPVTTSLEKKNAARYLIVERATNQNYLTQKEMLEVGEAMWKQTGRDHALWQVKNKEEKIKYFTWNSSEHEKLTVKNNGSKIQITTENANGVSYPATSEAIGAKDIVKYTL